MRRGHFAVFEQDRVVPAHCKLDWAQAASLKKEAGDPMLSP